jgi:hypothetical protein
MQPDHEQILDQMSLNRAPMITEDEPEPGKGPLDARFTAGQLCDDQRDLNDGNVRNGRKAIGARGSLEDTAASRNSSLIPPPHTLRNASHDANRCRPPSSLPQGDFENDIIAAGPVIAPVASRKMQILGAICPEGRDTKPNLVR